MFFDGEMDAPASDATGTEETPAVAADSEENQDATSGENPDGREMVA
jgi:hypothetical protein